MIRRNVRSAGVMSAGFTGAKPNNNAGGTAAFTAYIESGAASIPTSRAR